MVSFISETVTSFSSSLALNCNHNLQYFAYLFLFYIQYAKCYQHVSKLPADSHQIDINCVCIKHMFCQ